MQRIGHMMCLGVRRNEDRNVARLDPAPAGAVGDEPVVEQIDRAIRQIGEHERADQRHRERLVLCRPQRRNLRSDAQLDRRRWANRRVDVAERVHRGALYRRDGNELDPRVAERCPVEEMSQPGE